MSYLTERFLESETFQTNVVEAIKIHILRHNFFFSENRAVYEVMWKNIAERGRLQITI